MATVMRPSSGVGKLGFTSSSVSPSSLIRHACSGALRELKLDELVAGLEQQG